ncbi:MULTISPECIES: vanadium-dependent haloperoxidase [unclassified Nodularia (in: cyanobacteria)]|uniref:vanadium-dependent haloperoxidase n=1 Tax=unclassified Nodularia (in: cyanobacteria) TaxID=2656917 RepID=UPI00187FF134|nr:MULTISPECIES: vanadium-dependent haloperoxidase [unclassified Nodularia (in: cyanobacteria)]MBE9197530.1 vanadium-dependent haloperoxidase [Nodularia sp. LEGE 06071]MCC2694357.1 vanadium-dependent haloperoxidase [Nodularia sp. LEGE 04288]
MQNQRPARPSRPDCQELGPENNKQRQRSSRKIRREAAQIAFNRGIEDHVCNGEEQDYLGADGTPNYIANFSKGLPHNELGEVDPKAYKSLLKALESGKPQDFEAIPLGQGRKLTNPQAGLSFDLQGPDGRALAIPPAPRIDSPLNSGEMAEIYWMALLRDINFTDFSQKPLVQEAAADLSKFSDFRGPKVGASVTPETLFRGNYAGDLVGPYISQFLLKDIPYGSLTISQRQKTVLPDINYLTDYDDWLNVQNGDSDPIGKDKFDPTPRYIRNIRDIGQYVHVDALYEAYLNACLILLDIKAPVDEGNPYKKSQNQMGFGTFGDPHILSLVTEVATRALKAVWFQKWSVHRRLRPEAFGGLVHNHRKGKAKYPINQEILNSSALAKVENHYGTSLLPMAFPEGSPTHPAYGAGHATVAGACVTILKAWFDESWQIPHPVVPNHDGTELMAYTGADAEKLTVGGELNKVAANISLGRDGAGVHWRSDYTESVKLGEQIAIGLLQDQSLTYNEDNFFTLTKFDGKKVKISREEVKHLMDETEND